MKLLLINPPYSSKSSPSLSYGEPLGLAYLAAVIQRDARHEVEILDLARRSFDAMGVTLTNWSCDDATEDINAFLSTLKRAHPRVPLIIGGPEVTLEWETYSRNPDVDYLVLGDGENTIVDLLEALSSGDGGIRRVRGIVYRDPSTGGTLPFPPKQDAPRPRLAAP